MTTGNSEFQLVEGHGWQRGFDNLLRTELAGWWGTRKWWSQILIWFLAINMILFFVMLDMRNTGNMDAQVAAELNAAGLLPETAMGAAREGTMLFNIFTGLFATVGVIILMQGSVVGEKISGTAEWVLSKPVSRTAFILAKLLANTFGVLVTMIVAQGVIAYLIIYLLLGAAPSVGDFIAGLGMLMLGMFFQITLTLMLGALFNARGPVIGIPIAILFLPNMIAGLVPNLAVYLPLYLAIPFPDNSPSVSMSLMWGNPIASSKPVIFAIVASVVFVIVSLWAFNREEF